MVGKLLTHINKMPILGVVWDSIKEGVEDLVSGLFMNTIGQILWALCDIFFIILDLFEALFNQIAGISSSVRGMDGNKIEGDIVLYLVQSNIVQQVFMSIFILSLFLLIIFTIFAIVKNQYSDKQEPVSKIINSSVKALLMYLLVPVATVVCLIVGNIVLEAVNDATKTSGATSLSGMLFTTSSYNANKLRDGETGEAGLNSNRARLQLMIGDGKLDALKPELASIGINSASDALFASAEDIEYIATLIDEYYVQGKLGWLGLEYSNIYAFASVNQYYNLLRISYITVWIGGGFLIWAIGKITWGLVARMFKVTLYFAISPAVMATFPLDNGGALGKWRGEMVKNITMAYAAVGVTNVLYSILPFINSIKFVDAGILKLFLIIVAFSSAKDLISSISGWFGTGDALSEGIKAKSQWDAAQKKAGGIATKAIGRYAGIRGGIEAADKHGGNKFMGALQGFYGTTDAYKRQQEVGKAFQDAKKTGDDAYKTWRTMDVNGEKVKEKLAEYEAYDERKKLRDKFKAATGDDFIGGYYLDTMTPAEVENLRKTNATEYKKQRDLEKQLLKLDDAGKNMYFREFEKIEKKEKDLSQETGYYKKIKDIREMHEKQQRQEGAYEAELSKLLGGADVSTVSVDIKEAILSGNVDKLNKLGTAAAEAGDDGQFEMLRQAINNMTDQTVSKLNDMKLAYEQTAEAMTEAVENINEDIIGDKDFQSFAERSGFMGMDNKLGNVATDEFNAVLTKVKEDLKEAAELNRSAAEEAKRNAAAASQRHMAGTLTAADKARMKDYKDAHPS